MEDKNVIRVVDSTALFYMGGAYYVIYYLRNLSKKKGLVIPVFDVGSPLKKKVLGSYKKNRSHKSKFDWSSYDFGIKLAKQLWPVLTKKGIEADEIIATLPYYYNNKKIVIYTVDSDLYQLVDENVSIFNIRKKSTITPKNFEKITGLPKDLFVLNKILVGDRSDNIKGIITKVKFRKIFLEHNSKEKEKFEKVLANPDVIKTVMVNSYLIKLWPNFALLDWIDNVLSNFKPCRKCFKKLIMQKKDKRFIDFIL